MKQLFQQIEELIPTLHGWCTFEKASCLASYVVAMEPRTVVEIGTWGGKSAIPMLLAIKRVEDISEGQATGQLICIDPWSPAESVKGQTTDADRDWWSNVANHELVYQHFKHTVERLQLGVFCTIQRLPSSKADVPSEIDILHTDGNHGPEAYDDTVKFAPSVRKYGLCILDDLEWVGGHVRRAEAWLLENGFVMLHPLGTGAVYMRLK